VNPWFWANRKLASLKLARIPSFGFQGLAPGQAVEGLLPSSLMLPHREIFFG
jgi:hypothetical protein